MVPDTYMVAVLLPQLDRLGSYWGRPIEKKRKYFGRSNRWELFSCEEKQNSKEDAFFLHFFFLEIVTTFKEVKLTQSIYSITSAK